MMGMAGLPSPRPGRWRPLRIGLMDLFYYDVEEFHFHEGNLLLRGNNGTGKSKVLALTMPFLLDGELAPHRVEPDGDRTKRMEWNLLLGGRYEHSERIGYTWMEFGRRDADGTEQFTTIGAGLKAAAGRGIVRHWFFVTAQRIGPELSLLTPARTPLTRERLKEAIGEHGMVYDRAVDYRRAVDESLFGFGARYETLVSLLIQLRAPQLTKRPDEKLLSHALTDALPPLDENLIAQVADAFRGLDDERMALNGLHEVRGAATQFLNVYGRYARTAAKRKAAAPRRTHSEYEKYSQQLGTAQRDLAEAQGKLDAAMKALRELATRRFELEARQRALLESPGARSRDELGRAKEWADQVAGVARRQLEEVRRIEAEVGRQRRSVELRADLAESDKLAAAGAVRDAQAAAEGARVASRHGPGVTDVLASVGDGADQRLYQRARRTGEDAARWRRETIERLESLVATTEAEAAKLAQAQADEDRRRSEAADAAGRVASAEGAVGEAARALVAALHTYLSQLTLIRPVDPATLLSAVEEWAVTLDGDNPATRAVNDAADLVARRLFAEQADARHERDLARADIDCIDAELSALREGAHPTPPVPHTRDPRSRTGRPGAPLWKVTDFAPGVTDADRAGIEAALEAAGLLDAWVSPDGSLLRREDDDVVVVARPAGGSGLDAVLRPAINPADGGASALSPATVAGVLAGIGLGAQPTMDTWVAPDGAFRVGALAGRWRKPAAAYIGEGAREAARQARIAELSRKREFHALVVTDREGHMAEVDAQLATVSGERGSLPGDASVREAHTTVRLAREALERAENELAQAMRKAAAARVTVDATRAAAAEFGADVDLPTHRDGLARVRSALQDYAVALAALWPALTRRDDSCAALASAEEHLREALDRLGDVTEENQRAQERSAAARARHETLESTVGVAVQELQRRLDEVLRGMGERDLTETSTRESEGEARTAHGNAQGRIEALSAALSTMEDERRAAIESLRSFAATGLLCLACPDVEVPDPAAEWAATPAVALARAIDRTLIEIDDGDRRWELDQQAVNNGQKILADGLSRHGHRAFMTVRDDIMLVEVTFQGRTQQVAELGTALDGEIAERERILSARHREILENQLVSEVAASLQELISAAESQVNDMNRELAARPTSTGMKLRLQWRLAGDAPAGLAALRDRLLRQSADVWAEEDRRRLGDFLEDQIKAERLRDSSATWVEQLTNALDYRAWHEFAIQRQQEGQWRSATGPASGGERVLAASVPLFAAASSYYASSGNPKAPRLIALDEAFAGVDDDSRAKCLGLLATFDLDVMMTSEREWGCYPEVPGLAIAQLARREGIDAVLVTPWRWDGSVRVPVPRPEPYVPEAVALAPHRPARPLLLTMSTADMHRLRRLLGGDETRWIRQRVRGRLEQGRPLDGLISLPDATPAQRRAVETLLGRAPRLGRSLTFSLADLDTVIRRSGLHSAGIGEAVVALTGPVVVRSQARAALAHAWDSALAPLSGVVARRPVLAPWYEIASSRGLVKRACGTPGQASRVVASAARLLNLLPLTGTPLGQIANDVAGDAHALDHGRPLATIVLSAIRHTWWTAGADTNSPAQHRRALWDCVGIVTDELSTTALALNLPVGGNTSSDATPSDTMSSDVTSSDTMSALARILQLARECGEPVVLTLRQLTRHAATFESQPVFVCENPAVVLAAANALGPACPPLVCAGGQPTAAVLRLLSLLSEAGCSLHYHGDFDWGGIRIANLLWGRYPMRPWRFDAQSYLNHVPRPSAPLRGKHADALWDPDLSDEIARHGTRVEEEAVLADLLADLAAVRERPW